MKLTSYLSIQSRQVRSFMSHGASAAIFTLLVVGCATSTPVQVEQAPTVQETTESNPLTGFLDLIKQVANALPFLTDETPPQLAEAEQGDRALSNDALTQQEEADAPPLALEDNVSTQAPVTPATLAEPLDAPPSVVEYGLTPEQKAAIDNAQGLLTQAFELAKINDPDYQGALYEYRAGEISSELASMAYSPSVGLTNRFLDNESDSRTTLSITQPIFNLELIATVQEDDARLAQAQALLRKREYELADRVFSAVAALVQAQENLAVNDARVKALTNEAQGASREYQLGQGTITDVRDTEVRLEQARAEAVKLLAAKQTAIRQLQQLTGQEPNVALYALRKANRSLNLAELPLYRKVALQYNSDLISARAAERLAELNALKAKGAYLPSVNFTASRSYSNLGDTNNAGINFGFNLPVNAGTFYQSEIAAAQISQAKLASRSTLQKVELGIEQTYANVVTGLTETNLRLSAIEAAELSLDATEKSYRGGVRTRLDVLNALQTLYTVNEQYITSVFGLASNYLELRNQTAQPVEQTVEQLQKLLF